eukprot:Em0001g3678a
MSKSNKFEDFDVHSISNLTQSINTLNGTMETLTTTLNGAVQAIQSQAQVIENKCMLNDEQNKCQQREKSDRRLTEDVEQMEENQERQGTATNCSRFVLSGMSGIMQLKNYCQDTAPAPGTRHYLGQDLCQDRQDPKVDKILSCPRNAPTIPKNLTQDLAQDFFLLGMAKMVAEMQQMREDLAVGQEEAASKLARSSRRDPYSFRRKGNENQYRFCEDVEERLETTSAAIARAERGAGREALARAKAKEGMELLTHRKKLIKLADRSEVGWAVVEEYVDDDLADDSDDERRMEKAERAAERKVAAKRRKEREAGAKRARLSEPEPLAPEGKRPLRAREPAGLVAVPRSAPGACHQCGEFGHWRRDCPKRGAAPATYPLLESTGYE